MSRGRFIAAFSGFAAVTGIFFYTSFFRAVMSTASAWTGSGFVWTIQVFHNFLHGRPFQSSLYAVSLAGATDVGFVANPHGFINTNVIHVNWTPYLFAPLWGLHPTPAWLYGIQTLWSVVFSAFFAAAILRRLDPKEWRPKAAVALAVLVSSGLLSIINQMGQLLVFAGPLMLAVYHAALTRRRAWFYVWFAALCFVSEDATMVGLTFALYFFVFETENRRDGAWAAVFAFAYLAFQLLVIQPAARAELTTISSNTATFIMGYIFHLRPGPLLLNLASLLPALTLLPALGLARALFGSPDEKTWTRVAGLAIVPALPHWGESVIVGGGHHLFPPFFGLYLGLLVLLGQSRARAMRPRAALAWAAVYALVSLRALAGNMPPEMKVPILRRLRPAQAEALERSLAREKNSNLDVIAAERSIPKDDSLCFLGNNRVQGYLAARSDLWTFPSYYDETRWLLVQKDANDVNIIVAPRPGETLDALAARTAEGQIHEVSLGAEASALIRRTLVDLKRTHRVVRENEHVLLLENLHPRTPAGPPSTYGWGWVPNIGRRPKRA